MKTHGRHIKIVGYANPTCLEKVANIESLLRSTVNSLGMRMLGEPHMYEVETEIAKLNVEPFVDEGGVTGICVLSTSHCSIHTWPLRGFFVMDVYSCRDFDANDVINEVSAHFTGLNVNVHDVSEGLIPPNM